MAYSKFDIRYWQNRGLYKDTFRTKDGSLATSPYWSVRMMHESRQVTFALKTANKADAASRAREIYAYLKHNGWQKTFERFKPEKALKSEIKTVGDFLDTLSKTADINPKTLEGYAKAFRTILGSAFHVPNGGGGNRVKSAKWRDSVHSIKLSSITPAKIAEWKKAFLAKCPPDNPSAQRKAKISANSLIRRAKSLFAKRYLEPLGNPIPSPFVGIKMEKRPSQRYQSSFNILALIQDAKTELEKAEPELYKIFLLASMAGLRRSEIDHLEWSAFHWDKGVIRIEPTKFLEVKTEYSIGDIEVDHELLEVFRELRPRTYGHFVIACDAKPKHDALSDYYRCPTLFDKLIQWLRAKGVQGEKPLHELRKEFGSQLADKHGIYVASRMLRHSDIQVTAAHYLDRKSRKTVGLGTLLKSATVADSPAEEKVIQGNF